MRVNIKDESWSSFNGSKIVKGDSPQLIFLNSEVVKKEEQEN